MHAIKIHLIEIKPLQPNAKFYKLFEISFICWKFQWRIHQRSRFSIGYFFYRTLCVKSQPILRLILFTTRSRCNSLVRALSAETKKKTAIVKKKERRRVQSWSRFSMLLLHSVLTFQLIQVNVRVKCDCMACMNIQKIGFIWQIWSVQWTIRGV